MINHAGLDELLDMPDATGGSRCFLYVVRHQDVVSLPTPARPDALSTAPIVLSHTDAMVKYEFQADSVQLTENAEVRPAGSLMTISIRGFREGNDLAHRHEITKLLPGLYILIYEDNDGHRRLLGTKDRPLSFSGQLDSGQSADSIPGVDWEFSGIQVGDSVYLPESIDAPSTGTPAACSLITNNDFSITFSLNSSFEIQYITLAPAPLSSVSSITNYVAAAVYGPTTSFDPQTTPKVCDMIYNSGNARYEVELADQPASLSAAGDYYFYAPNLEFQVLLTACSRTVQSVYNVPISLFDSTYDPQADWQYQSWNINSANELQYILADPSIGSSISTVDTRPLGTITFPDGTTTATLTWNSGNNRYEPTTAPITFNQTGSYSLNIPAISLTLTNGATGTATFGQNFSYTFSEPNQPPTVTNVRIEGDIDTGSTITLTGDFSDAEGHGNASTLTLYQFDDVDGLLNGENLGTFSHGATYVILGSSVQKYLRLDYTPQDDQGGVGTMVQSIVYGPVEVGPYNTPSEDADYFRSWDFSTATPLVSTDSADTFATAGSGTAVSFPSNVSGSLSAALFDSGQYLSTSLSDANTFTRNYTIFIACQLQSNPNGGFSFILSHRLAGARKGFSFLYKKTDQEYYAHRYGNTNTNPESGNVRALPDTWVILTASNENIDASNDQHSLFIDETKVIDSQYSVDTYTIPDSLEIGLDTRGHIGEIVICDSQMDDERKLKMIKYLAQKWIP